MGNVLKHCSNLHQCTFILLIDHWKVNWVAKSLCYWHLKSWDCLLTHCPPMKSILFLIETISRYQFRCYYLRNKKFFLNFLLHFWNLAEILYILEQYMTLIDFAFPKLLTPKTESDKCIKNPVSEDPSISHMVNVLNHCGNLHHSSFIIFIGHCQVN